MHFSALCCKQLSRSVRKLNAIYKHRVTVVTSLQLGEEEAEALSACCQSVNQAVFEKKTSRRRGNGKETDFKNKMGDVVRR